jgi:hypothetical protein
MRLQLTGVSNAQHTASAGAAAQFTEGKRTFSCPPSDPGLRDYRTRDQRGMTFSESHEVPELVSSAAAPALAIEDRVSPCFEVGCIFSSRLTVHPDARVVGLTCVEHPLND